MMQPSSSSIWSPFLNKSQSPPLFSPQDYRLRSSHLYQSLKKNTSGACLAFERPLKHGRHLSLCATEIKLSWMRTDCRTASVSLVKLRVSAFHEPFLSVKKPELGSFRWFSVSYSSHVIRACEFPFLPWATRDRPECFCHHFWVWKNAASGFGSDLGWSVGSWPLFWSERGLGQLWEPSYSFNS